MDANKNNHKGTEDTEENYSNKDGQDDAMLYARCRRHFQTAILPCMTEVKGFGWYESGLSV